MNRTCKDKDGGTHHFACECQLERIRTLEEIRHAVKGRFKVWTFETYEALCSALEAYDAKFGEKK